ncbi:hypothetical protein ACU610_06725 [Geodermatophilus sp. URMC 61]|uniref:hypothetical protein n=1 Tax=Geodermatophilus sp. URMC 61 TaxID=3423411 RepID=UPI00406C3C87
MDRALAHAEESRRLNVRALRVPPVGRGTRTGLDALEYASVSLRTLFRTIDDATRERTGVEENAVYADIVRRTVASLLERMGNVVREFGHVLVSETPDAEEGGRNRLSGALEALRSGRALMQDLLIGDPRSHAGLWELNSTLLATIDRMLDEFGAVEGPPPRPAAAGSSRARRAAVTAGQRLRIARRAPAGHGSGTLRGRPSGEGA